MRNEKELRKFLEKCSKVADWGMSNGPCPLNDNGESGCCAECSFPSGVEWVLGADINPSYNAQEKLIDVLKGKGNE